MGCNCLPPPEFDLPQPPDPSLVWNLIADSGESLVHYQKSRLLQACAYKPLFGFLDGDDIYLPALLCVCFVVVSIGCLVSACVYRKRRRQERKKCLTSSMNTSKTGSGASDETSGGGAHWSPSYNSAMNLAMPSVEYSNNGSLGQNKLIAKLYGSSSSNNLFHAQPIVANANTKQGALIRTLPKRTLPHQIAVPNAPIRMHPQHQFPSQYCLHHQPMIYAEHPTGYCTLASQQQPQYEEIGSICPHYGTHYAANPICCEAVGHPIMQRHDSETIFEDLSENLRRQERRPPPNSRPPPPPSKYQQVSHKTAPHSRQSNSDSSISDELGSASDVELEQLAQFGITPLPMEVLHARQQSANDLLHGRESGYGTGSKARANHQWHSPPQLLRPGSSVRSPLQSSSSGHSSQHNSPPSASVPTPPARLRKAQPSNNNNPDSQNMTYV